MKLKNKSENNRLVFRRQVETQDKNGYLDREGTYKIWYYAKEEWDRKKYCYDCQAKITVSEGHRDWWKSQKKKVKDYDFNYTGKYWNGKYVDKIINHYQLLCCACEKYCECLKKLEEKVQLSTENIEEYQKILISYRSDIQRLQSNLLGISQSVVEQVVEDLKNKYEREKKTLLTSQERKKEYLEQIEQWKSAYENKRRENFVYNVKILQAGKEFYLTPSGYIEKIGLSSETEQLFTLLLNQEKKWGDHQVKITSTSFFLDNQEYKLRKIKQVNYGDWDLDFGLELNEEDLCTLLKIGADYWEEKDYEKWDANYQAWKTRLDWQGVNQEHRGRETNQAIPSSYRDFVPRLNKKKWLRRKEGIKIIDFCPACQTRQLRQYAGRWVSDESEDWRCLVCDIHYFPNTDIRFQAIEQLKNQGWEVNFETRLNNQEKQNE